MTTEIIDQPVNVTPSIALENVTLRCSASVDDVIYSWHRVEDGLPLSSRGQNSNTLTIHRATPNDEGLYYCNASKDGVNVKSNYTLVQIDGKEL